VTLQDLQELASSTKSKPTVNNGLSATTAEPNGPAEYDGFRVQIRRKRISSGEEEAKKRAGQHMSAQGKTGFRAELRNYFPPLRSTEPEKGDKQDDQQTPVSPGRQLPIL
jgi:hypothetical protein